MFKKSLLLSMLIAGSYIEAKPALHVTDLEKILFYSLPNTLGAEIVKNIESLVDKEYKKLEKETKKSSDQFLTKLANSITEYISEHKNPSLIEASKYAVRNNKILIAECIIDFLADRFITDHSSDTIKEFEKFTKLGHISITEKILHKAQANRSFELDVSKPEHINPGYLNFKQTALLLDFHGKLKEKDSIMLSDENVALLKTFAKKAAIYILGVIGVPTEIFKKETDSKIDDLIKAHNDKVNAKLKKTTDNKLN
jgi:hypothetical protein